MARAQVHFNALDHGAGHYEMEVDTDGARIQGYLSPNALVAVTITNPQGDERLAFELWGDDARALRDKLIETLADEEAG